MSFRRFIAYHPFPWPYTCPTLLLAHRFLFNGNCSEKHPRESIVVFARGHRNIPISLLERPYPRAWITCDNKLDTPDATMIIQEAPLNSSLDHGTVVQNTNNADTFLPRLQPSVGSGHSKQIFTNVADDGKGAKVKDTLANERGKEEGFEYKHCFPAAFC